MRIGIMTFWWSEDNYGQLLQCYALQKYLRDAGHDAYLIRYRNMERSLLWKRVLKGLNPYLVYKHIKYKIKTTKVVQEQTANSRHFDGFRDKYIRQSQRFYCSYKELQENPPEADVYVVGSDQVWNFSFITQVKNNGIIHAYMLDFGDEATKKISYAASWSMDSVSAKLIAEIKPLLRRFCYVSVREEQGVELCRRCGCENARWVCDPTLLLPAEKYRSLYRVEGGQPPVSGKYLFLYMLANSHRFDIQSIYDFAQQSGLQVVYVTGNGVLDKREKCFATIPQWLSLVDNAEYVVTNSFHCCVFSVLFQKRFAVVPLSGPHRGMNSRMESLFSQFGMEARWLGEDFSVLEREFGPCPVKKSRKFLEVLNAKD